MPQISFQKWRPDLAPISQGTQNAYNVVRVTDGYEVMPSPSPVGFSTIDGMPIKMLATFSASVGYVSLVLGTAKSYRAAGTDWAICPGSEFLSESWATVPWGKNVYAVNGVNPLQKIKIDDLCEFEQAIVPNGLSGKYMAAVFQFLVLVDVRENMANARYPERVQWSGFQRPERFEPVPNAIQSDFQDVQNIGELRGITGGEFGLIFGANGLVRMDYVGPDIIFEFNELEINVGCEIPQSIVRTGNMSFWWSRRGWRMSTGDASIGIGVGHCDKWFARFAHAEYYHRMSTQVWDKDSIVMWSFVSTTSLDYEPDCIVAYNWDLKEWTFGQIRLQLLGEAVLPPSYTDDANLPLPNFDAVTSRTDNYSQLTDLESNDKVPFLAAMVDGQLNRMEQSGNIESRLETNEMALGSGMTTLTKFIPIVHAASRITATVKSRNRQVLEEYRVKEDILPEGSGVFSIRVKARYHTLAFFLTGPFKRGIGVEILEAFPGGGR